MKKIIIGNAEHLGPKKILEAPKKKKILAPGKIPEDQNINHYQLEKKLLRSGMQKFKEKKLPEILKTILKAWKNISRVRKVIFMVRKKFKKLKKNFFHALRIP